MPHLGGPRPKGLGLNPNAPFSTLYFYGGAPMPYSGAPTTLMPVTLPPGRFRLATTPISTGPSGRLSRHPKAKHMDRTLAECRAAGACAGNDHLQGRGINKYRG